MYYAECLTPMIDFLRGIGIGVEVDAKGAADGFLPGVHIHAGVIHVDPDTLVGSGDLLHEAGHIAILPRRFHASLNRDLFADMRAAIEAEQGPGMPADPVLSQPYGTDEMMAQAWSYAAAVHIGVPPDSIFFPGAYKHHDYEGTHPMQRWIESGTHYGIAALGRAGMTGFVGIFAELHPDNGLPPYPQMAKWVQE